MTRMETLLKEINAVLGVVGSFVCSSEGGIAAQAVPESISPGELATAARLVSQTFHALETSGHRVNEADLVYRQGRLVVKNLRGGLLVILCARHINLPLLNLTANVVAKKLAAQIRPKAEAGKPPAPAAPPTGPESAGPLAPSIPALVSELTAEACRIVEQAARRGLHLKMMNFAGLWIACPGSRAVLAPPEDRQIALAGLSAESKGIDALCRELGYESNQWANTLYGNQRLNFGDPSRLLLVEVFLDRYEQYHRLDLAPFLRQEGPVLAPTAMALARLQVVDMTEGVLRELAALTLQNDLSVGTEREKIDASAVTRLCADDWGWYKTTTLNLDRLTAFAATTLEAGEAKTVAERARRLRESIDGAPKSLRWQTRARLGETVKWYESPEEF